jgi:methanogenic corrinoid protein MtbC1
MAEAAALSQVRARYLSAQLKGNRREALRLVIEEGVARGATAIEVQQHVIQEAQREIGRLWQENQISIAEEHMATAISHMALAHLYDHAPRAAANGKRVVVSCVEGELHDFPARLVADALDLAGFDVRYLGANVPTASLVDLLCREPPDLLALSVTMGFNAPGLRAAVQQVRAWAPVHCPIISGGAACAWIKGLAQELRVAGTAENALDAVRLAQRLLGVER